MSTTIQKWGNSLGIRIPKRVAKKVGFEKGSEIEFVVVEDKIILRHVRNDLTLEEFLRESRVNKA